MNSHSVPSPYLSRFEENPQQMFTAVCSHAIQEDARGYQTLQAAIIRRLMTTPWTPEVDILPDESSKRRAGYMIEFAARKMVNNRERKLALFALTDSLWKQLAPGKASLFPEAVPCPNPHSLARRWGLTDGASRANILKLLSE